MRDLKVIGILMRLQGGFTKHCCFLCLLESRTTAHHYETKEWPTKNSYAPGVKNIQHTPLVNPDKVLMPPLHIKLGLMKNFVKAMAKQNSNGFKFLFKVSQAKPSLIERRNFCWSTDSESV